MNNPDSRLKQGKRYAVLFFVLAVSLIPLFIYWSEVMLFITTQQKALHKLLSEHIMQVAKDSVLFSWGLILLSFLYGVFHAIGPGHGKAIIVTYMGTQQASLKRGVFLSFSAAMLQAVVAVVLVLALGQLLQFSFSKVNSVGEQLTVVGYALVALLGLYISIRALLRLNKERQQFDQRTSNRLDPTQEHVHHDEEHHSHHGHHSHRHEHSHDCGCNHVVEAKEEDSIWQQCTLVMSMGLRPCSGALIVLTYAVLVNALTAGILATFAMAFGTGIAVATIALATVFAREYLNKRMSSASGNPNKGVFGRLSLATILQLVGGSILLILGVGLVNTAIQLQDSHPLF